jgi:transposase
MEAPRLAPNKKNANRLGAHIVFVDESGFLLIPSVRKTWAPRGETPLCYHRYRREKVSAISGISLSPKRQHCGLYFQCHIKSIRHAEVCAFIRHLLKHLRGPVIIVWDNAAIHKGAPIRQLCSQYPHMHLELLPPYAPELNPDEGVWNHAKRNLANGQPMTRNELRRHVTRTIGSLRSLQPHL